MTPSAHTRKAFDEDLRGIVDRVRVMGETVATLLDDALDALRRGDAEAAAAVVERDTRADALDAEVQNEVLRVIARQAPVAADLRRLLAAGRIASALERIGDHAKSIARRVTPLQHRLTPAALWHVRQLGEKVRPMLDEVAAALAAEDAERARGVWLSDEELDAIYRDFFQHLLFEMKRDSRNIEPSTHLMFVAKSLERIGDYATNIAEDVIFQATGVPASRPRDAG